MVIEVKKDRIVIASPPDYEQLTAEIFIDDQCVALVSRDLGDENMQIELLVNHAPKQGVSLELFTSLIEKAKSTLREYDRV